MSYCEVDNSDEGRFLNVKQWKGSIDLRVKKSMHHRNDYEGGYSEDKLDSDLRFHAKFETSDGMISLVAPFGAQKDLTGSGTIDKGDMFEGIDFKQMQAAMKRSGLNSSMIMGEINKMKGAHISANKYKLWDNTQLLNTEKLNVSGHWHETNFHRSEGSDGEGGGGGYEQSTGTTDGDYQGIGSIILAINLQKQVYSFKWNLLERSPQTAKKTFHSEDSDGVREDRTREVAFENFTKEMWFTVKFEPLPNAGLSLTGTKTWHNTDDDGVLTEVTLQWRFVPVDCEGEADILYEGKSVKDKTIEVFSGEKIELAGDSVCGESENYEWIVPGKYVENYTASISKGVVDPLEDDELKKKKISFYWWDEGTHAVKLKAQIQGEIKTATTQFIVRKPDIKLTVSTPPGQVIIQPESSTAFDYHLLAYAMNVHKPVITFTRSEIPKRFTGETSFIQVVTSKGSKHSGPVGYPATLCYKIHENGVLDTAYPYNETPNAIFVTDNPVIKIRPDEDRFLELSQEFVMFLMYKPSKSDAIFVPIKKVAWNWNVSAALINMKIDGKELTEDQIKDNVKDNMKDKKGTMVNTEMRLSNVTVESTYVVSGDRISSTVKEPVGFPVWKAVSDLKGTVWKACVANKRNASNSQ
jgi:hypothetical protein